MEKTAMFDGLAYRGSGIRPAVFVNRDHEPDFGEVEAVYCTCGEDITILVDIP
jgi:hypothetical protein